MSYDAIESSVQDGSPVYLIEFVRGDNTWRFVTRSRDIDALGESWTAASVKVGDIVITSSLSHSVLKLTFPVKDDFARNYVGYPPEQITSVTIYRAHIGDIDAVWNVEWKGRIRRGKIVQRIEIDIECESIFTSIKRPGLRQKYQKTCRHAIYGRGCNLDRAAFAIAAEVESASGLSVVVPEANGYPDKHFVGGFIELESSETRMVIDHVGTAITLIRPMLQLEQELIDTGENVAINIYPGCNQTRFRCETVFDNLDNHGGFLIPKRNPFDGSSIV